MPPSCLSTLGGVSTSTGTTTIQDGTLTLMVMAGLLFLAQRKRARWLPTRPAAFSSLEEPFVA
jgi:hypothetical protein